MIYLRWSVLFPLLEMFIRVLPIRKTRIIFWFSWSHVWIKPLLIVFIILEALCSVQNNKGNKMQHDDTARPYSKVIPITTPIYGFNEIT